MSQWKNGVFKKYLCPVKKYFFVKENVYCTFFCVLHCRFAVLLKKLYIASFKLYTSNLLISKNVHGAIGMSNFFKMVHGEFFSTVF